ncbi:TonB-dependent receptor domain-containing protein [Litorivivens sp.]|uniref:TonB-dependent receptor domain-containing protein n=1 Tax=Litorivivens sp. TaxID=2020868 RepID=UPI0035669BCF
MSNFSGRLRLLNCCAPLAFISFVALAEPAPPSTQFETLLVTASRWQETASESLATTTLIERTDIDRLQATELSELLMGLPGLSVSNSGGPGKSTSLFVRGTESDHVLVLIDGVKVGSATSGAAAFEHIPVAQIERIELVRGPRSSLYGSEALGGVIQIFTRNGSGIGFQPTLRLGGGNYGRAQAELGLSGGSSSAWYGLALSAKHTDGLDARPAHQEPDADGYENLAGSLRLGWQLNSATELGLHYLRSQGENEYDSQFSVGADGNESTLEVLGAHAKLALLADWEMRLTAGMSRDEYQNLLDDQAQDRFNTRRMHGSWINTFRFGPNQTLALGLDVIEDKVDSNVDYAVASGRSLGSFAQYQLRWRDQTLQMSLRNDDDEQFGAHTTAALGWAWQLNQAWSLSGNYGSAYKAPSFNELYYPNFGNPDLGPEKARSSELGLDAHYAQWHGGLHLYQTRIQDLITTVLVDQQNFVYAPRNVAKAQITGLELILGTSIGAWTIAGNATWLEPENRSPDASYGKVLRRRPQRTARLDLDYAFAAFSLGASFTASSERFENTRNSQVLPGFLLLDLRGSAPLSPAWRIQAHVRNALNTSYETALGYQQFGRTYWLGLDFRPQPQH